MSDILEQAEEDLLFGNRDNNKQTLIFNTDGSSGANSEKLAQILTAFDLFISIMGWEKKPLANFTKFLTSYQASVNSTYHKDYKDIKISEEVERKRSERKGTNMTILSQ